VTGVADRSDAGRGPALLVLDFDGVICDGMAEFFESSWRAWERVGSAPLSSARREELRARFVALRPVVESGWEMALLPALLAETDRSQDGALQDGERWAAARDTFLRAHGLTARQLADALDAVRDVWFSADRDGWLRAHRFYPGVPEQLRRLSAESRLVYVLSTKEKRFLDHLLASTGVTLPTDRVIGKATPRRAKWEVIQELATRHGLPADGSATWFVEDRLATLQELRHDAPALAGLGLFLATWGYVFPDDVERARTAGVRVLTLAQFTRPFDAWT
jgi:phosphoglycolate phosphatase-like HAD superfamily hydrolase